MDHIRDKAGNVFSFPEPKVTQQVVLSSGDKYGVVNFCHTEWVVHLANDGVWDLMHENSRISLDDVCLLDGGFNVRKYAIRNRG